MSLGGRHMESRIDRIKKQLHSASYKLTPQREATVAVLLENEEDHLSAEDVYLLVKEKAPEIGLATVYRTLQLFEKLNIVYKINFDDGLSRYELNCGTENHHHHHLICLECGKVIEVKLDLLENLENEIENEGNFKIVDHNVKFYGYCNNCRTNVKEIEE